MSWNAASALGVARLESIVSAQGKNYIHLGVLRFNPFFIRASVESINGFELTTIDDFIQFQSLLHQGIS